MTRRPKGACRRGGIQIRHLFAAGVIAGSGVVAATPAAHAFCVANATEARLLFTARIKGEAGNRFVLRRWIKAGDEACAGPQSGTDVAEVFVFADEDSIEGCDDEIAAAGTLQLRSFIEFDNCVWARSR